VNSLVSPISSIRQPAKGSKRATLRLSGLVLASILGASCAGAGGLDGKVLTIDGSSISKAQLEEHLEGAVIAGPPGSPAKTETGAWSGQFVADNLNSMMFATAIHAEHEEQKLAPVKRDPKMLAEFTASLTSDGSDGRPKREGKEVIKTLSKFFIDTQLNTQSEVEALYAAAAKENGTPQEFFQKQGALFAETCIKHILVAAPDAANRILAELNNGGDFAAIAKKESTDTGSGAAGGVLPCSSVQQFVPEFAAAATKLKVGEISKPVRTQFGFHILSVISRKAPKFADVESTLPETMQNFSQNSVKDAVFKRLNNAKISVDSSFAGIDRSGEVPQMVAPNPKILRGPGLTNLPVG
jgi:PPIC-type PPIASE domain